MQPTPQSDKTRDSGRTARKRAAVLAQLGRFAFRTNELSNVPGSPLIYWWPEGDLKAYAASPKVGDNWTILKGLTTCNNTRFVRKHWEVRRTDVFAVLNDGPINDTARKNLLVQSKWVPWIDGSDGRAWLQELDEVVLWSDRGLQIATAPSNRYGRGESVYFRDGLAFTMIGSEFSARRHRFRSIIGNMGASIYGAGLDELLCALNSERSKRVRGALNPTLHFEKHDVARLPAARTQNATEVMSVINVAFAQHEQARETSFEFVRPGASTWESAKAWADQSVSSAESRGFAPQARSQTELQQNSFAIGCLLGRFHWNGGYAAHAADEESPVLFVSPTGGSLLGRSASLSLREEELGKIDRKDPTDWLRNEFFGLHKSMYENRPVYFPLSSKNRSFVAYVHIHAWKDSTLGDIIATHLLPEKKALEGALTDLKGDRKSGKNEKLYTQHLKWIEELDQFIKDMRQIAEHGPEGRDVDAPYSMDLDDGVMVNASALWPLLEPMWKEPKKWWKELSDPKGKKDYDWAHLANRYFPKRVDAKCKKDPSLAVAHGCFWRYHPEVAYAWELRLQDEIGPDFTIDEKDSKECRKQFLAKNAKVAAEIKAKELARRAKKKDKSDQLDLEDEPTSEEEDE
jgi:hypothetical protein